MKASVVVEGTLGSLVPRLSPPHDVEALRPQPALWEGLCQFKFVYVWIQLNFLRFVFQHLCVGSTGVGKGPEVLWLLLSSYTQAEHVDPQFRDLDLHGQSATSDTVILHARFSLPFCFPNKTTRQVARDSPVE